MTVPSPGGGETLIEVLNILEAFPSEFLAGDSLDRHHALVETFRIADRRPRRLGQPDVGPPSDEQEPRARSRRHDRSRTGAQTSRNQRPRRPRLLPQGESTTQVSVIDQWGNIVSLTQTLSRSFGAKVAAPSLGFFYNSFLESFSVEKPQCGGQLRPRSLCINDMAPTIVLRDEQPIAVLGTPGSNRIPGIISAVISNIVDRKMTLREAVTAPRIVWGGYTRTRITVEMAAPYTHEAMDDLLDMGYMEVERVDFPAVPLLLTRPGGVNAVSYDSATGVFPALPIHEGVVWRWGREWSFLMTDPSENSPRLYGTRRTLLVLMAQTSAPRC